MTITYDDFKKLHIKIGKILSAEKVPKADKLIKMEVDLGDQKRQIVAGIAEFYKPEDLVGKQVPILANLEPRTIRGVESQGMILIADAGEKLVLMNPECEIPSGSSIE